MNAAIVDGQMVGWDDRRGTQGMVLFILTEAMLFVVLFFGYFYLGRDSRPWPPAAPKLGYALGMLAVLLTSSLVLHAGEKALQRGKRAVTRISISATIALGLVFLALQSLEYREQLKTVRPTSDAYGSIFFTITGFHGCHLIVGLLMLAFVVILPELEPTAISPYRPVHNVALYWHFVDAVWVVIVLILYVSPSLRT